MNSDESATGKQPLDLTILHGTNTAIRETAEALGLVTVRSRDIAFATRRFEESTGTKVAYHTGGHPRTAGFTPPSRPNLILKMTTPQKANEGSALPPISALPDVAACRPFGVKTRCVFLSHLDSPEACSEVSGRELLLWQQLLENPFLLTEECRSASVDFPESTTDEPPDSPTLQ